MKKVLERNKGALAFYALVIISAFMICIRFEHLNNQVKEDDNRIVAIEN